LELTEFLNGIDVRQNGRVIQRWHEMVPELLALLAWLSSHRQNSIEFVVLWSLDAIVEPVWLRVARWRELNRLCALFEISCGVVR
jgi:hypothetical protein